jgi:hypothetical protein
MKVYGSGWVEARVLRDLKKGCKKAVSPENETAWYVLI